MSNLPKSQERLIPFTLPVKGDEIHYRPFKVKEEKILLMAAESADEKEIATAFKQVIRNCVAEKIDPGKLPLFDLECLFIILRTASVNEIVKFNLRDKITGEAIEIEFDLKNAINKSRDALEIPEKKIQLTDDIGVIMGDLTLDVFMNSLNHNITSETELVMKTLAALIDKVYDNENVYDLSEYSEDDVMEFIDDMPAEAIEKLKNYVENIPRLELEIPYTDKSGDNKIFKLEGLSDFFQYA